MTPTQPVNEEEPHKQFFKDSFNCFYQLSAVFNLRNFYQICHQQNLPGKSEDIHVDMEVLTKTLELLSK